MPYLASRTLIGAKEPRAKGLKLLVEEILDQLRADRVEVMGRVARAAQDRQVRQEAAQRRLDRLRKDYLAELEKSS